MGDAAYATILYEILYDAVIFTGPPLILATLIAFLIGLFQAVTQIQEQTLPQTLKIVVITIILLFFGNVLAAPLYATTLNIFDNFGTIVN